MKSELVSLCIPVYNSAEYLSKCLDSVLAQTWQELEVICVDDGSTDDSLRILNEYAAKDNRICVFTKENEGKGAASARNLALENATGGYIQFLDSDDFFEPEMVEMLVTKAIETGAEVVICRGQTYDHERGIVTGPLAHPDLGYAPDKESFHWTECSEFICEIADFYAWNKLFRRSLLIDNNLKFSAFPIADDQDISMLAPILAKCVAVIDRPFISYRVGTGTSQCDSQTRHPEAAYVGVYSVVECLRKMGVYEDVKQSYCNVAIRLMREYFDRMTELDKLRFLYNKYRDEIFPLLGAKELPESYFHDKRVGSWYRMLMTMSLDEILFSAARAGGGMMTTAPLRFQVPYDLIKKHSCIVLVGKGLVGRYWYSQLLLSQYCDVVCWTDSEEHIPEEIYYDAVVKAI